MVGGIAKTVEFNGYRFDLGGHRFFTKIAPVQRLWEELLGDELLVCPRLSRIYYDGKFLAYPLQARTSSRGSASSRRRCCALSYVRSRPRRPARARDVRGLGDVRTSARRLYDAFFRSYTEKVWGIPGSEIHAEWAAQRIKDFSLGKALLAALGSSGGTSTTLIEEFHYPRLGPGQMWEALPGARRGARHRRSSSAPRASRSAPRRPRHRASSSSTTGGRDEPPSTPCSRASR